LNIPLRNIIGNPNGCDESVSNVRCVDKDLAIVKVRPPLATEAAFRGAAS